MWEVLIYLSYFIMSALFVLFIVDVIREIKESSNAMTEIIADFYEKELKNKE